MVSLEELLKAGEEFEKNLTSQAQDIQGETLTKEEENLGLLFPLTDVAGVMHLSKEYLTKKVRGMKGYGLPKIDRERLNNVEVIKNEVGGIVGITSYGIKAIAEKSVSLPAIVKICKDRKRVFCEDIFERKDCNIVRTLSNIGILTNEFFVKFLHSVPKPIKKIKGGVTVIETYGRSPIWNNVFSHRIDEAFFNVKEIFNIAMEEKGISMEIDVENLLVKFV